jgi:hypothetical protein
MAQMSNYLESGLLNYLFRSNTNNWSKPLTVAVALCTNVPAETQHGGTIPELANSNNYERYNLGAPANSIFTEITQAHGTLSSGLIDNAGTITFGPASADWGYVSGIAILDSGVHGAGNLLMYGALANPRDVKMNDTLTISAGALDIYFG